MRSLEDLTGQTEALAALRNWALASDSEPSILLLGPSGSGKSWVVGELDKSLSGHQDPIVLVAEGDHVNSTRTLFPFMLAATRKPRLRRLAKAATAEAGRGVPYAGGFVQFTLNMLLNYREISQAYQTPFLAQDERDVLLEMQLRAAGRDLVLVLENLQWWDNQSLNLLALTLSKRLDTSFPFLQRAKYLAVITPEQAPVHAELFENVRKLLGPRTLELAYCRKEDFGEVLQALGATKLPSTQTLDALFRASGGHLAMAERLAEDLNRKRSDLVALSSARQVDSLCRQLLEERVGALGERGAVLDSLLRKAAAIGVSFTRDELQCLANELVPDLRQLLDDATALNFLSSRGDWVHFSHEIIQRFFATGPSENQRDVHRRFAECLRILRPGDYRIRSRHQSLAGDNRAAQVLGAHYCLSELRAGRSPLAEQDRILGASGPIARYVSSMTSALQLFQAGDYDNALLTGEQIDDTLPSSLLAERDCLLARCHIKLLTKRHRSLAPRLLERWTELRGTEIEVWSRVTLARIIAQFYDDDLVGAKAAAHELGVELGQREAYDPGAKRTLCQLKLKADMLYGPEVANAMLSEALEFFGPVHQQPDVRDPTNYLTGITNLAGNQLLLGDFEGAFATAQRGERFLGELQERGSGIIFPRVDMLANNLIVAAFRCKRLAADECSLAVRELLGTAPKSNDTSLLESNQAAFQVLAGRPEVAIPSLESAFALVSEENDYDSYYVHFIGNNLAGAYYACSQIADARKVWAAVGQSLANLQMPGKRYLERRYALQSSCFDQDGGEATVESWECHIERLGLLPSVGPAWPHFAKGFLLSDLQYWSDN